MRQRFVPAALAALLPLFAVAQAPPSAPPPGLPVAQASPLPPAPVREVRETLHGVDIVDPYRWLEDSASPEAQAFFKAQGEETRAVLERLPVRAALLARIRELSDAQVTITGVSLAGGRVFYLRLSTGRSTPVLCVREGFAGAEKVLVDPADRDGSGARAAINWYHASPDGSHVAYGISSAGTEDSVLRVVEVPGGRDTGVAISRARFNANLGWHHDGRAFYYAHVPEGIADPLRRYEGIRVYRHVLGRPAAQDEIVFASGAAGAAGVPRFVYPSILVPEDSVHAYAIARDGVRREIAVYMTTVKDLAKGLPAWRRIVDFGDEVTAIRAWKDDIFLLSHKGAPRFKVLHMKAGKPDPAHARTAVAQGDSVILDMALAADALYLRTTVGGLERLERLNFAAGASSTPEFVKTAFDVSISQLVAHPRRPGAVLRTQGFVEAPAVIAVEAKTGNLKNTGLQPAPRADFASIDEVRLYAPGHDGTKIPVTLLYRKSTMLGIL